MLHFTQEQIDDIVGRYANGETLQQISNDYSVSRPTIDRIDSNKGYIKGNVWIISNRANTIKNNASLEELELLVSNLKKRLGTL